MKELTKKQPARQRTIGHISWDETDIKASIIAVLDLEPIGSDVSDATRKRADKLFAKYGSQIMDAADDPLCGLTIHGWDVIDTVITDIIPSKELSK